MTEPSSERARTIPTTTRPNGRPMNTRQESDTMGTIDVPASRLWGAQTQRSLETFAISTEKQPKELLMALVRIKRAAAKVNHTLGLLDGAIARSIQSAADEILGGDHLDEFPLVVWQTGSGTQTNMNVNEVLAHRASDILGGPRGHKRLVHPNDHVNLGQSSNDVYPSAIHLAAYEGIVKRLLPALRGLSGTLREKSAHFADVIKLGRTHLQDATPVTLGQELGGYASQLDHAHRHIEAALGHLAELALGGTAVGTGLGAHRELGVRMAAELAHATGLPFVSAPNKFEALATSDAVVHLHGALKGLAVSLFKIANDVRWMASGPRGGLGEIHIPENEPGSSIMPGKVNPTQCEAITMLAVQVMGNDATLGFAGASGNFELNVYRPLIAHVALQSIRLLADGMKSFDLHCARGIEPRREHLRELVGRSLMLVTALSPRIGYDASARIAKRAHHEGSTLREAALAEGILGEDFDDWVRPEDMLGRH